MLRACKTSTACYLTSCVPIASPATMPVLLRFTASIYLGATVGLSSCCDCSAGPDYTESNFAFSADSLGRTGFRRDELRTAYLVTYAQPGFQGLRDTTRQRSASTPPAAIGSFFPVDYSFRASPNAAEFSLYAHPGLSYRIVVPAVGRVYEIDNVSQVFADREGDGCNCEEIKEQSFTIDGQSKTLDRQALVKQSPIILQR